MANNKIAAAGIFKVGLRLKITKKAILFFLLGVFVVLAVALFRYRTLQITELQTIQSEMEVVQSRLSALGIETLQAQKTDLDARTEALHNQLASLLQQIEDPAGSIEAGDRLFDLAAICQVDITNISAGENAPAVLEQVTVYETPVTISLQGNWQDLTQYISRLKTDFTNCYIDEVKLSVSEDESTAPSTLDLIMVIYTYRGGER